jgi:hypothetical protein
VEVVAEVPTSAVEVAAPSTPRSPTPALGVEANKPPVPLIAVPVAPPDAIDTMRAEATKAIVQERDILRAARANAVGLLVTSQVLLKALHDGAPQIRSGLLALALEKPALWPSSCSLHSRRLKPRRCAVRSASSRPNG